MQYLYSRVVGLGCLLLGVLFLLGMLRGNVEISKLVSSDFYFALFIRYSILFLASRLTYFTPWLKK